MKARPLCLLALLFFALLSDAFAGLDIKRARYGTTASSNDVRKVLEAYVRMNTLSFPVNAGTLGGDPNPGQVAYLFVVYEANGREFTDTVADGKVFTFKGLANVRPVQPPLNLPILKPISPGIAPLRVINQSGRPVRLYSVDRFGRWNWAGNLRNGESFAESAQVGQDWVVTDLREAELQQIRIKPGRNIVTIDAPFVRPPPGSGGFVGGGTRVRFENVGPRPLFLYSVDQWGGWIWMANLEPGGAYAAPTRPGENWVAADRANRIVQQVPVAPGMSNVRLK